MKNVMDTLLILAKEQVDEEAVFEATKAVQDVYNDLVI